MTIAIKGNTQGGVIEAGGVPAANITSGSGIPFMKNKLINGEVTRINQRGVANWAAVANGTYGYDRWRKIDASNMTQIIEAGNFRPNTVHTLSGIGVTTQQITSPASGNWQIPNIPIAATNVQVEEGLEATPFEVRHIGFELALCQRYYEVGTVAASLSTSGIIYANSEWIVGFYSYKQNKRALPSAAVFNRAVSTNMSPGVVGVNILVDVNSIFTTGCSVKVGAGSPAPTSGTYVYMNAAIAIDAEL